MLSKLRHIAAHRSTVHCGRLPVRCHHIVSIDNCTSSNTAFPTGGCERERECEGVRRSVRTGMRDQQQSSFVGMHSRSRHLAKRSRPTSVMRPSCTDIRTLIAPHEAHPAAQPFVWRKVGRFQTRVQLLNPVIFIFILFCCFFFFFGFVSRRQISPRWEAVDAFTHSTLPDGPHRAPSKHSSRRCRRCHRSTP